MSLAVRANYDTLRSLAFGGISGTYAALGTAFTRPVRVFKIVNNTDGDMFISTDGATDMDFIPANSFCLYDLSSNREISAGLFEFPTGTQFYVKQSTAPTKNAVYLVVLKALPINPAPNNL